MEGGLATGSQKKWDFFPCGRLDLLSGTKAGGADGLTHQILVATGKGEGGEVVLQSIGRDGGSPPSLPPSLNGRRSSSVRAS